MFTYWFELIKFINDRPINSNNCTHKNVCPLSTFTTCSIESLDNHEAAWSPAGALKLVCAVYSMTKFNEEKHSLMCVVDHKGDTYCLVNFLVPETHSLLIPKLKSLSLKSRPIWFMERYMRKTFLKICAEY